MKIKIKRQLRSGEFATPLGTFSEAVEEIKREKIYTLIIILCILLICFIGLIII